MSAYVVTDFHINGLVTWAAMHNGNDKVSYYWEGRRRYIQDDEQRVASVLYAQNVRSVNSRYSEAEPAHGFKFKDVLGSIMHHTQVEIIKACHCYDYQSCQNDDWPQTEAHAIVKAIEDAAIRRLSGYEDAAWGLREPEDAPQVISLFKLSKDIKAKRGQA